MHHTIHIHSQSHSQSKRALKAWEQSTRIASLRDKARKARQQKNRCLRSVVFGSAQTLALSWRSVPLSGLGWCSPRKRSVSGGFSLWVVAMIAVEAAYLGWYPCQIKTCELSLAWSLPSWFFPNWCCCTPRVSIFVPFSSTPWWMREWWPRSIHIDRGPQRKWGWGSFRRRYPFGRWRGHQHHRQFQCTDRLRGRRDRSRVHQRGACSRHSWSIGATSPRWQMGSECSQLYKQGIMLVTHML